MKNRLNFAGLLIVALFFILAIFGSILAPHSAYQQDIQNAKLLPPSTEHWMGTDELGRDVMSRIMVGARYSLQVAAVVLTFSVIFGTLVGAVAGFFGGFVDEILMRFTDMFLAFPALVLAIAIAATLGRNLTNTMIALATVFWPWYARLVRGQVLAVRERDYVDAGRSIGMSNARLMFKHILPNCISVVIIQMTLDVGYAVLATSSLSFIGLGAQPPTPEWGAMLNEARADMMTSPHVALFPALAIFFTVLAFNLLGDGLRDALDPKIEQK